MNSTDLHTLLAVPPLSRAIFFAQLLAEPSVQSETDTSIDDQPTEPAIPPPAAQTASTGFPA